MNDSRRKTSAILAVVFVLIAADAQACGELMLRGLGAMRYHAFVTRNPAAILLYSGDASSSSKRPAATDDHVVVEKIRGHDVHSRTSGPEDYKPLCLSR